MSSATATSQSRACSYHFLHTPSFIYPRIEEQKSYLSTDRDVQHLVDKIKEYLKARPFVEISATCRSAMLTLVSPKL